MLISNIYKSLYYAVGLPVGLGLIEGGGVISTIM